MDQMKRGVCLSWTLLSFCIIASVSGDQKNITAKSGHDVTLPCRVPKGKTIKIVKWSRADLRDEYVLLFKDGQPDPENQNPSFKNRVDLQDRQMNDGDVSLILKNVTADDGAYQCQVFVGETRSWELISTINLRVVSPGSGGDKEDGSVGLIVGLSVSAVLLVAAVGGYLFYKKHKHQGSY